MRRGIVRMRKWIPADQGRNGVVDHHAAAFTRSSGFPHGNLLCRGRVAMAVAMSRP